MSPRLLPRFALRLTAHFNPLAALLNLVAAVWNSLPAVSNLVATVALHWPRFAISWPRLRISWPRFPISWSRFLIHWSRLRVWWPRFLHHRHPRHGVPRLRLGPNGSRSGALQRRLRLGSGLTSPHPAVHDQTPARIGGAYAVNGRPAGNLKSWRKPSLLSPYHGQPSSAEC